MKLGYLGPKGTFSYEAANEYVECKELIEYKTIQDIILGIKNNEIDEGIVPIENSLQGGVTEAIDTLVENDGIFIKNEIILKIRQNLMANKKYNLEDIKQIYSHPQALAQCRNYISNNLHNALVVQTSSTALAAQEIKNKDYFACIANKSCAKEYGLEVLKENIQDNNLNQTKFWILSKKENFKGTKMALIFSCQNQAGALYRVLGIFNENNINLTKIESRPAKTVLGEYIFLVDLDVNEKIDKTINLLKNECSYIRILGRY